MFWIQVYKLVNNKLMFDGQQSITSGKDVVHNLIFDLKKCNFWIDSWPSYCISDSFSSAFYSMNKIIFSKDPI
jgi:hypothetical protein